LTPSKIKERLEGTSDGPWEILVRDSGSHYIDMGDGHRLYVGNVERGTCCSICLGNARFITHARTDVPALVAEVERLQELLDMISELAEPAIQSLSYLFLEADDDAWKVLDRIKAVIATGSSDGVDV
jgi:hypothetical protein